MRRSFLVGGLAALSLALSGVAQAQSSCDAGITKAAGKKVGCKFKVIATAQQTGVAADTARLAKCETKFASSCAKALARGDCIAQTATCDAIEVTADACVDSLSGAFVLAQSSCDAGITKAAGKKVDCKLKVIAKAQQTGVAADTIKLARCETKFTSSCAKAQGRGDCTAQTATCDAIEVTADACVDDLDGGTSCTLGQPVGNSCWFLGALGADCDATCAAQGLMYDDATATYAGSSGTSARCQAVVHSLLGLGGSPYEITGGSGVGCVVGNIFGLFAFRDPSPTTSGASHELFRRACACM